MSSVLIVFDFNRTLFDPEQDDLMDGAKEVLELFTQKGFLLFLIAKGGIEREEKIEQLGIKKYFTEVSVVPEKNKFQLQSIRKNNKSEKLYSVGDRVKTEIKLGNECGFETIWFQSGKFATQLPDSELEQPHYTIHSLRELTDIITQ